MKSADMTAELAMALINAGVEGSIAAWRCAACIVPELTLSLELSMCLEPSRGV